MLTVAACPSCSSTSPERERAMRIRFVSICAGVVVLLAWTVQLSAVTQQDAIKIDLKNFKFKGQKDGVELLGYNEGEGKLFYYINGLAEATVKLPADGDYEITVKA